MSGSTVLPAPPARPTAHPAPRGVLARTAAFAVRRRWTVVVGWVVALLATVALSGVAGGEFEADYTAPGSSSRAATDLLAERFPARSGETVDVVVRSEQPVTDPAVRAEVERLLAELAGADHVVGVDDPYATPGAVAPDGRTLLAHLQLDVLLAEDMPVEDTHELVAAADRADVPGGEVALGGQVVAISEQGEISSETIGLIAAAVILLVTFGSVVAAGLPLLVALVGLGISGALVALVAAVVDVPDWSTSLAAMMGIGVGIDYVLLMVTRYREFLADGLDPATAAVATVDTAGRSVLVAGSTVVISLTGLAAMGLSFMTGAALATIAAVLVVMLASVTLLPALLGLVGRRVDALRLPGRHTGVVGGSPAWARWSRLVQRRAVPAALAGTALLLALAAPLLGVRFGFPDAGNNPEGVDSRRAYDLVSAGFGPGANGPLVLAADLGSAGDVAALDPLVESLQATEGVAAVSPAVPNPAGDTAVVTVVPTTSPQSDETEALVTTLRDEVVPAATAGTGAVVHVGGVTASAIDSTDNMASRLPALIGGVVALSFLLLLVVFRSLLVAVKAAIVNLLSIAAAYGVVALVLEGGWAGRLVGIDTETPLPAFIPVLMFAILFGLSMDYEVFLLTRIRERWLVTRDAGESVADGLAMTARVISAAAAIMVAVFAAFVPSDLVFLKVIGIGLATAIFVDATVVRMLLVPAVMQLLGRASWWLPRWLDRLLPQVHVEGHPERYVGPAALASVPAQPAGRPA